MEYRAEVDGPFVRIQAYGVFGLFVAAVCAASQSLAAQITDIQTRFSMLCVAEKGTGFNWKNNDWVQTNYVPYSYILTKVEPDPTKPEELGCHVVSQQISPVGFMGESRSCYEACRFHHHARGARQSEGPIRAL